MAQDKAEQQKLIKALRDGFWLNNSYLLSRMRQYFKHEHTLINKSENLDN